MDYEQKYKEAIAKATRLYEQGTITESLAHIFPELKESEDERHRKWVLEYLYDGLRTSDKQFKGQFKSAIAWLEKQKEPPYNPYKAVVESIAEMCKHYAPNMANEEQANDFLNNVKVKCKDAMEFEKQKPQEETSKQEPKFKVGDWIVNNKDGSVGQIQKIINIINYEEGCGYSHSVFEKDVHLWTIDDAKDGDVLAVNGNPFIYCLNDDHVGNYCCLDGNDFRTNFNFLFIGNCIIPATQEQRDLLFSKMKEAGYKWDAEKKVLKNIEAPKQLNADEVIEWLNHNLFDGIDEGYFWSNNRDIVNFIDFIEQFKKDFEI